MQLAPGMHRIGHDIVAAYLVEDDTGIALIGFAERLRRKYGVPIFPHRADVARARGEATSKPALGRFRLGPTLRFLSYAPAKGGMRSTHLTAVTEVIDGRVLDAPGSPRIIALPGHTTGSIAVHVPSVDAVQAVARTAAR